MSEANRGPLGGSRDEILTALRTADEWDLIVVGGGITGAGILREAARCGLRCLLLEQKDFAWGTSSRSSKMVHGGLRYIAQGQLKLTHDSVRERERLLNEAPGLVERSEFTMTHYKGGFPGPLAFSAVMNVYGALAGKRSHRFYSADKLSAQITPGIREEGLKGGTCFHDAIVDDARLVLRVLYEAMHNTTAQALNYCRVESLLKAEGRVAGVNAVDELTGETFSLKARVVVNATGVWTDTLRKEVGQSAVVRPLRGSHLVVPSWRLPVAQVCCFMHPADKRPVFIFPWEGHTVIGTTDLDYPESLDEEPAISEEEISYLLDATNHQFPGAVIVREDVISTWTGVRPVISSGKDVDPSKEKREHAIWDDHGLITVCGGKLTTFRLIALEVMAGIRRYISGADGFSPQAPIFSSSAATQTVSKFKRDSENVLRRLKGRFGFATEDVVADIQDTEWTPVANTDCLWGELRWAARHEQVVHLDDLLLRRTRIGNLLENGAQGELRRIRAIMQEEAGWDAERWIQEVGRYQALWRKAYSIAS
ncbi:glycerol-3-phosphate dehydrogenase/oxidase [Kistimonas scapharcae]|uniref:Glycerol-3-phosphate dehydrogenase/oxidase n=1 Tax=Kistimonas scapharcae TaxID=1036133 RepID=A0ABP8V1H6_9GAMM